MTSLFLRRRNLGKGLTHLLFFFQVVSLANATLNRSEISEIRCIYEAAHLLGQAFRHIYTPTKMEEFNAVEAVFIMNTLVAYRTLLIEKEQDHGELMSSAKDLCNRQVKRTLRVVYRI